MIDLNDPGVLADLVSAGPSSEHGEMGGPADGFTITVRYLRASADGETVSVGVELCDLSRDLREQQTHTVLTELISDLKLRRGPIAQETLEELERLSRLSAAYGRALSILAYGANSASTLVRKLRQRGFDAAEAEAAAALIRDRGYLREEQDALREAERALSKGWGDRRIQQYLRQRGYPAEAVRAAMEALANSPDRPGDDTASSPRRYDTPEARCAKVARRKCPAPPADTEAKQKLSVYLLRQGYDMAVIRRALLTAWDED